MKFFRLLLSLHSVRLITISAIAITYLAMTTANSSKKAEAMNQEATSIASDEHTTVKAVGAEFIGTRIEIKAIASQRPDPKKASRR